MECIPRKRWVGVLFCWNQHRYFHKKRWSNSWYLGHQPLKINSFWNFTIFSIFVCDDILLFCLHIFFLSVFLSVILPASLSTYPHCLFKKLWIAGVCICMMHQSVLQEVLSNFDLFQPDLVVCIFCLSLSLSTFFGKWINISVHRQENLLSVEILFDIY